MNGEQKITNDIKIPNKDLEVLRLNFANCFDKNGKFDIVKLQSQLNSQNVQLTTEKESYGLDWLGKSYARLIAGDAATTLLRADQAHNAKPENANAQNVLLKGDNLEVLKHLASAYYEKIKMIYIDPPYNTGSDGFVYEDDRKFTVKELQNLIGISAEKAKRILDFTNQKSNSHSAWLTFMYPRLYIAKQLLKEDGVIFISIDDNEVAQLRLLMDEVFGEENFVGQIVWQTATDNNLTQIAIEHEYVLVFAKNLDSQEYWEIPSEKGKFIQAKYEELKQVYENDIEKIQYELRKWIRKQTNGDDLSGISHYSYVDEVGVYYPGNSANTKPDGYDYDIKHPITKKNCAKPEYGYRFTFETFKEADKKGDVQWGADEKTIPKIKKRLDTVAQKLKSYYYEDNRTTSAELKNLFSNVKIFNNPKSVNFIKHLLKFLTNGNDLILDFFAGSGTTGDAVMQLNAEDGGNRKFILVQIPELIDSDKNKVTYDFVTQELKASPTIFEITKERLLRAAQKINTNLGEKIAKLKNELPTAETQAEIKKMELLKTQNGFKVFETLPIWENYDFEAHAFDSSQTLFDIGKLTEDDLMALLTTWKTYDGIALTQELATVVLGVGSIIESKRAVLDTEKYTAYYGNHKLYLMHKGFTTDNLVGLLEKVDLDRDFEPKSIIAFGHHFDSKNLIELGESVKYYANKKKADIDFIIRF
jgi:adenine-specific DNA-methyltransferase